MVLSIMSMVNWVLLVVCLLIIRSGNAFQVAPQHQQSHVLSDGSSSSSYRNDAVQTISPEPCDTRNDVIINNNDKNATTTTTSLRMLSPKTRNDQNWLLRFEQLSEFQKQHGHCNPSNEDNSVLCSWTKNQRMSYKNMRRGKGHNLTPARVALLNSIPGFVWSLKESKWMEMYFELREFVQTHGHCHVPSQCSRHCSHKRLARWVTQQRQKYKQATDESYDSGFQPLSQQQIQVLNQLNFTWNPRDDAWRERYRELEAFKRQHGHCNVPQRYQENAALGKWCHHQRRACKEYVLSIMIEGQVEGVTVTGLNEERINALREIDFCWLPNPSVYEPPPKDIFTSWYSAAQ